jgi:hypothetical protein
VKSSKLYLSLQDHTWWSSIHKNPRCICFLQLDNQELQQKPLRKDDDEASHVKPQPRINLQLRIHITNNNHMEQQQVDL